ncbi:hypothetical protein TNCV_1530391 [Trichonephila clavipes]|uniref:Uncharacterized protein n=1 Tax=Trichonephila clavipes TaxID=2585209 RepID=A0A8X6R3N4_TRICX|nr:hypothetical protein TNCV_1530391 [Trichonephila clavipes]
MDEKENNSLFTPGLSNSVEKDTRGTVKCSLRNGLAQWAGPGIEPVASRTLSENHTPRPRSLVKHGGFDRKLKREPLAPEARNIPLDHGATVMGGIFSFIAFNILVREFLKLQLVIRIVCVIKKEPFPLNT